MTSDSEGGGGLENLTLTDGGRGGGGLGSTDVRSFLQI